MSALFDVIVVGSGPSGALAASKLVRSGKRVLMLDVANDDDKYRQLVPDVPFSELRRTDADQRRYFLGDELEGVPSGDVKVGAQLTPPRQFVTRDTDRLLPVSGDDFDPMQSLALGGLGAAWGAACFTYTPEERRRVGIDGPDFERFYNEVAGEVGVSGDPSDDASQHCFSNLSAALPALELDTMAENIWRTYGAKRRVFRDRGVSLGRTPLAILSEDFAGRSANPYFDMDFWSDSRRSVFRPRYLVEELEKEENFRLDKGMLVCRFESLDDGVKVRCLDVDANTHVTYEARRLLLCAGAIGSARITLASLGLEEHRVPILCNPYHYFPCLNLRMLGQSAEERRHSLSQLIAIYAPGGDADDVVSAQFYSYRSLLLFKLVKEIPLPPWAGLLVARLVVNALVIIGLHHSDAPHADKTMRLLRGSGGDLPEARFDYRPTPAEQKRRDRREAAFTGLMRRMGIIAYGRISPGHASSIHYAGTLPMRGAAGEAHTSRDSGQLWAAPNVYVGDGSTWNFLPAKGLTFTLMANARRVAENVLRDLESA